MILVDGHVVKPTIFPDKTSQVWKLPKEIFEYQLHVVEWQFENEAEFLHIAQLCTLLEGLDVTLHIPFFPYARQDKVVTNETTFALKTFCNLLNTLPVTSISTLDVHNEEAVLRLLTTRLRNHIPHPMTVVEEFPDIVVFADESAGERYREKFKDVPTATVQKRRDQKSGYITAMILQGDFKGKKVLVVDDMCDGGATFQRLACHLEDAESIDLYVTHGIFSNGFLPLAAYDNVYTHKGRAR